jgi:hypothetical protein
MPRLKKTPKTPSTAGRKPPKPIFQTKNFFLTASNMVDAPPPDFFLGRIMENKYFPQIRSIIIAQEKHSSGVPHYHAILSFHKRKSIFSKDAFNFIFEKETHIAPCKQLKASAEYITKGDNYVQWGEPLLAKRGGDARETIINFLKDKDKVINDLSEISSPAVDRFLYMDSHKVDKWWTRVQAWHHHQTLRKHPRLASFHLDSIRACLLGPCYPLC